MENQNPNVVEENSTQTNEPDTTDYKALYENLKKDNDNLSKYNKDLKGKYQAKLSDEEKQKALLEEREEMFKAIERENQTIKLSAELSKSIKDEKVLSAVVLDLVENKPIEAVKKINDFIKTAIDSAIKEHDAQLLKSNPIPPPVATSGITKEQFANMTVAEKTKVYNENNALYNQLMNELKNS